MKFEEKTYFDNMSYTAKSSQIFVILTQHAHAESLFLKSVESIWGEFRKILFIFDWNSFVFDYLLHCTDSFCKSICILYFI